MFFKNIEKVSGTNDKIIEIKKEIERRSYIKEALIYAVNKTKYNISKQTLNKFDKPAYNRVEMSLEEWNTIKGLLDKLRDREVTKQEEIGKEIENLYKDISEEGYAWFDKICRKDLCIGILSKGLNKALGEKEINNFEIMLADSGIENINFKDCYVEPKLDGVRAVIYYDEELIVMSRGGKRYAAYEEIINKILTVQNLEFLEENALDSEIINADSFRKTSGAGHSKHKDRSEMNIVVNVFDYIPVEILLSNADTFEVPLIERKSFLEKNISTFHDEVFKLNSYERVSFNKEDIEKRMNNLVIAGYEGAMIKDVNGFYEKKRSSNWIKVKPVYTVDIRVVGYEEGKRKNELGAFVIKCDDTEVISKVGSGFTKEEKKEFWINREKMIGKIIEVEFQEIQDTLRFPRFIKVRDDKNKTDVWSKVITWNPNWMKGKK